MKGEERGANKYDVPEETRGPRCAENPAEVFQIHALVYRGSLSAVAAGCCKSPIAATMDSPDAPIVHHGCATFYNATGAGVCSYDTDDDLMVRATVGVTGPESTILKKIADLCPGCSAGSIDLDLEAFAQIADTSLGKVPISWYITASSVTGPIIYHFKSESTQYRTAARLHLPPEATFRGAISSNRVESDFGIPGWSRISCNEKTGTERLNF